MTFKPMGLAVAWAIATFGTSTLANYLQAADLMDAEASKRMVQVVVGLGLAAWCNYMPKRWGAPAAPPCGLSRLRSALRVGGWAMTLAGLGHAAVWAFAPMSVARPMAIVAVASATVITMAYGAWVLATCGSRATKRATPF